MKVVLFFVYTASAYDRREFGADFRAIHSPEIYIMIWGPRKTKFCGEKMPTRRENHESGSLFAFTDSFPI